MFFDTEQEVEPFHLVRRLDLRDLPKLLPYLGAFSVVDVKYEPGEAPRDARRRLRLVR